MAAEPWSWVVLIAYNITKGKKKKGDSTYMGGVVMATSKVLLGNYYGVNGLA